MIESESAHAGIGHRNRAGESGQSRCGGKVMKAIRFRSFGGPERLECLDIPAPSSDSQSAVVQIKSASVNPSDVKNIAGTFTQTSLPRTPGRDFSGVVVEGPPDWRGVEVWGTGGDIGFTRDGSHAEFMKIPVQALSRKPTTLSHAEAAAIGVNFVVAWLGVVEYARLAPGETIAVIGAAGGVGGAVVQIAKAFRCTVIGLDLRPPLAESPAGRLIDEFVPFGDDAVERVRAYSTDGVSVVYDAVGGIAFETALRMSRPRGRVVEISATGKRRVEFDLIDFYRNELQLFGVDSAKLGVVESAPLMKKLAEQFESWALAGPIIAHRFPLARAREAYRAVATGTNGRVVLDVS
jgi:NADPH2:quinone reductase